MASSRSPALKHSTGATEDLGVVDGLVQLSFSIQAIVGRVTARYDASIIQARLLGALRDRELSMAQIAGLLNLDKSSATGLVDRAESKGYVARKTVPQDGRSVHVTLTSDGRRIVNRVANEIAREIDAIVGSLSDTDRARLSLLASKVVQLDAVARGIDLATGHAQSSRS
ncbi:MAG: MarR family transcriptional regulator [Acidimicrobiales bacterium]|jgi:DNA-binding MarR family transcriptional regulator